MVTINNSNLISGVFETLYDVINSNVTDTQIPARSKWWFSAYPDQRNSTKSDFPIGIINPPNYTWLDFTLTKKWAEYETDIDVYSSKAKEADVLLDSVLNALESNRRVLAEDGIIKYRVVSTSTGVAKEGNMTLHIRTATIQFRHVVLEAI